jgi:hypothetical protein
MCGQTTGGSNTIACPLKYVLHTLALAVELRLVIGILLLPASEPTGLTRPRHSVTGTNTVVLQSYEVKKLQHRPNGVTAVLYNAPDPIHLISAPLRASNKYDTHVRAMQRSIPKYEMYNIQTGHCERGIP